MGLWEMIAIIVVACVIGGIVKSYMKRHVSKQEMIEIRDTLNALQKDVDEIKIDVANIVIQLDDIRKFS